ncbi:hypothetical protein IK110_02775 [Candidatus Saccharibacteria bacterium]|nr:hypothetical protein [Candidatus Saccharibacteria bacterium]
MNNIKKISVASIISVAAIAAFAGNASAATEYAGGNISGQAGKLQITRNIDGVSNNVTNTFNYTIAEAADNPGTSTGFPTTATITFNNVAPASGVATANTVLDFTNTTFPEVGDYYYTITESSTSNADNYPKTNNVYRAIVSVRYKTNANNVPTSDLVATVAAQVMNSSDAKEDMTITIGSVRTHIEASMEVKGNSADVNKCFTYTINIPAKASIAAAGDTYTVSSSTTCDGKPAIVTVGETNTISLKHGDTVTIGLNGSANEMPIGLDYTIALNDKFDYENPYFNGTQQSSLSTPTKTTVALTDSSFDSANKTPISIEKNVSPNTGVFVSVFPFIVLAILAGAGTVYVTSKSKKNA